MKAITIKLTGYILLALCLLSSCEDGGAFPVREPYVRGSDYGWGYMYGTVEHPLSDEKYLVNHVQHPNLKYRQGHRSEFFYLADKDKKVQRRYMSFSFHDKEARNYNEWQRTEKMLPSHSAILLTLVDDFRIGILDIVHGEQAVRDDEGTFLYYHYKSSLSIDIYEDAETANHWGVKPVRYVPDKNEPFLVHLDIVEFNRQFIHSPILEGRMKGVLYREGNPEDYMVVDMRFGL